MEVHHLFVVSSPSSGFDASAVSREHRIEGSSNALSWLPDTSLLRFAFLAMQVVPPRTWHCIEAANV